MPKWAEAVLHNKSAHSSSKVASAKAAMRGYYGAKASLGHKLKKMKLGK